MFRRGWLLYPAWIALCAALFFGLRDAEDPSRRRDRMLSSEAGVRALRFLRETDPARFEKYEVVHVAYAGRGEAGDRARWVVLCDRVPHTALREAIVLELDARGGALLTMRAPVARSVR